MATVLRLKRSLCEDPADGIIVWSKRVKSSETSSHAESRYFSFIGTVRDEDEKEIISKAFTTSLWPKPVKSAVKSKLKDKWLGVKSRRVNVTEKQRIERLENSHENRLKLVNTLRLTHSDVTDVDDKGKDMCSLYDIIEGENVKKNVITCNGTPLVQTAAFDLYLASSDEGDDPFAENVIGIEKCCVDEQPDCGLVIDSENIGSDDSDSNDENNWRNDYPDEDFEQEFDNSGDYDDDDEEILRMIESCNVHDQLSDSDSSCRESPLPLL